MFVYEKPQIETVVFEFNEIVTASVGGDIDDGTGNIPFIPEGGVNKQSF
jgi:hypothetical protein